MKRVHNVKNRVLVDLVTLWPGRGGTGGGVWRYASTLVEELGAEALRRNDLEVVVLMNRRSAVSFNNVRTVTIPNTLGHGIGRLLWVNVALWFTAMALRADVVHKVATEVPVVFPRIPLVTTVHDFMAEHELDKHRIRPYSLRWWKTQYFVLQARLALSSSVRVIFPSAAVKHEAEQRYSFESARGAVLHNGIHATLNNGPPDVEDRPFTWLAVAAFSPHKGHLEIVRALHALAQMIDGAPVHITFHGHTVNSDYYTQVRHAITELPPNVEVTFRNFSKGSSMAEIYAGFQGLILLSEYEGFGLPLLEAQAAGLVVVASDIDVFVEVVGSSALLVEPGDYHAVAKAMMSVACSADIRNDYRTAGTANLAHFTWRKCAQGTAHVYGAARQAGMRSRRAAPERRTRRDGR